MNPNSFEFSAILTYTHTQTIHKVQKTHQQNKHTCKQDAQNDNPAIKFGISKLQPKDFSIYAKHLLTVHKENLAVWVLGTSSSFAIHERTV